MDAESVEIEPAAVDDLVRDEHHVAQHGEQVLLDAADHLAIDEGRGRRVVDLELDAPGLAHDLDFEVAVAVEDLLGVVGVGAAVEHGQRALAEQRIQAALARVEQLADLGLGEILEAAARTDAGVDEFRNDDAAFHAASSPSSDCPSGALRQDFDRRVVRRQQPDLHHVGVRSRRCSRRSSRCSRSSSGVCLSWFGRPWIMIEPPVSQ